MDQNETKHGGISIELEHIFPIIKKWLYSEKEIFVREIVSNACDAVTKLNRLVSLGEAKDIDISDPRITVELDADAETITVTDNGIGMTADETEKYLGQIALSGALDFIQKYEGDESDGAASGIIGHFGLGFYSAFMVCDKVDVITRSYNGAPAVKWTCDDSGNYDMTDGFDGWDGYLDGRGTAVVMHINDEGREYLSESKLKEVLDKYCSFMPVRIFFNNVKNEKKEEEEKPINDTAPLWQKNPADCTDEEYKEFYRKVFHDYREPLFQIHLKADYPLNFKGILYFPKITGEYESLEGQVKLFYNQVFVADNIKEVIPEYLLMLKGVLDCPELPLNVSRSYLQNSGYVSKISAHITKKVADKLNSMFTTDRENFEKVWRDIKTFVEYGCMRDRKFYERVNTSVIYEKCAGGFTTLDEYLEAAKETHENKIYYANDKAAQAKYISMLEAENIDVILLDKFIDTQFINTVEQNREGVKFCRVDAEVADVLKDDAEVEEYPKVKELFEKIAGDSVKVDFGSFKDKNTPAILNVSEETRRFDDMMKIYSPSTAPIPLESTLTLNSASPIIAKLDSKCSENPDEAEKVAREIFSLCKLTQRRLTPEEMKQFLDLSYEIIGLL